MHTHKSDSGHEPEEIDASVGYEQSDIRVTGIIVFLTSLGIFVVVSAVLCYGIGMLINGQMAKTDGPPTKWNKDRTVDTRGLGNLANSPALQNKFAQITQQFPTPRLQTDDGNQEIADLHSREDLLLNNYSWVDRSQGKVRIPIDRAIEVLAQRGLPVAAAVDQAPLMAGDTKPMVAVPLTNGFTRTGYEHDRAVAEALETARGDQK